MVALSVSSTNGANNAMVFSASRWFSGGAAHAGIGGHAHGYAGVGCDPPRGAWLYMAVIHGMRGQAMDEG